MKFIIHRIILLIYLLLGQIVLGGEKVQISLNGISLFNDAYGHNLDLRFTYQIHTNVSVYLRGQHYYGNNEYYQVLNGNGFAIGGRLFEPDAKGNGFFGDLQVGTFKLDFKTSGTINKWNNLPSVYKDYTFEKNVTYLDIAGGYQYYFFKHCFLEFSLETGLRYRNVDIIELSEAEEKEFVPVLREVLVHRLAVKPGKGLVPWLTYNFRLGVKF